MRIIVTGDRHWNCRDLAEQVVNRLLVRYGPGVIIVHGAATGVDTAFAEACEALGVEHEPHPADWERFGKSAGPRRNASMIARGADLCIAVHKFIPRSKGTKGCAKLAIEAGIPTYLIDSEAAKPKRLLADDPRLE